MPKLADLKINTEIIQTLKPCFGRYANWRVHYSDFDSDIIDFLSLDKITPQDKIWVAVRLLPNDLIEIFAIDCAFSAATYAAAHTAIYADAAERERQVDALIFLIENYEKE